MPAIIFSLILGRLKSALGAAVSAFRAYPWQTATIALLCLSCWLWRGWHGEHAGRAADMARVSAAQVEAGRIAQQALAETERRYRMKADATDHAYEAQLAAARSLSDRYALAHRVRANGSCPTGATPAPAQGRNPESAVRPGEDAIVVSRDDFDTLTENTLRLKAARDWAVGLNH